MTTTSLTAGETDDGKGRPRPVRIVAVDDDDGIRALLQATLSIDERFELLGTAADAAQMRELLVDHSGVDAILVDVSLPDTDGVDLVAELRQRLPDASIALFTGWDDAATNDRALAAGADRVFAKDGDIAGLINGLYELAR